MNYENKKILFMGDSITELNTCERGWVKYFNEIIKPSHFVNTAVSGAWWQDYAYTKYDGNPVFNGPDNNQNNVMGNQVEKIIRGKDTTHPEYVHNPDYDDFDIIIIAAGTNGGDNVYTDDYILNMTDKFFNNGVAIPFETADRHTREGAMLYCYYHLRRLYKNAKIFICSPIQGFESTRPYKSILSKSKFTKAVCDFISDVIFVDTFNCGICGSFELPGQNGRDLIDGLHPNANGAKKIGIYNAREVIKAFL